MINYYIIILFFVQVEEIEKIDDASWADTFFNDATENEKELALTEEQKKKHVRVLSFDFTCLFSVK